MKKLLGTSMLIGMLAVTGFGQVNARKENQQDRVAQGVRSGQLTPGETTHLENKEHAVNGEVRADRQANGGKLTSAERTQIKGQQNGLSKQIYADKHNTASDHFGNGKVGQRKENQQDRIAQGVQSGRLNAGQTAKLENREANINSQTRADRAANGGKLTNAERKNINRQQNGASRAIYRDKQ